MKITNKLNSIIKIQLFICLVLSMNFGFANTKGGSTSNSKLSATDVNDFNEKTKQEKREKNCQLMVIKRGMILFRINYLSLVKLKFCKIRVLSYVIK